MKRRMRIDRPTKREAVQERPPHFDEALRILLRAWKYANMAGSSVWDYAVEIHEFRDAHVPINTLRWLVDSGCLEHRFEKTGPRSRTRQFKRFKTRVFADRSCFVLTESGVELARKALHRPPSHEQLTEGERREAKGTSEQKGIPHWDAARRVLSLGDKIVKQFNRAAPFQELLLTRFEQLGWPACVDDPLPLRSGTNPKRRLHDMIKKLNQRQTNRLIHFYGDGSGRRLCWRPIGPSAPAELVSAER